VTAIATVTATPLPSRRAADDRDPRRFFRHLAKARSNCAGTLLAAGSVIAEINAVSHMTWANDEKRSRKRRRRGARDFSLL
jgi:Mn2+/Fe2+ NRAMP family transporter